MQSISFLDMELGSVNMSACLTNEQRPEFIQGKNSSSSKTISVAHGAYGHMASVPLEQVSRLVVVTTDASRMGWDSVCNGHTASVWMGWDLNCSGISIDSSCW